jgi:hypothetical protein
MRLSCLDCGARFRVDPRARVRTFRVACRRCGAPIVHRGPGIPDGEVWFVTIAGETAGPFRASLVVDLLERGTLGENPLAWRSGFEEWLPLAELEPFAAAHERFLERRANTAVLSIEDLLPDPDAPPRRTLPPRIAPLPAAETRPLAAVEFVAEPLPTATEQARTFGRVSRLIAPREEATGIYSLSALQQQAQSAPTVTPELPAFPPTALASVAVPLQAAPALPPPLAPTPPPKAAQHFGLYVMMFLLMASIGGLTALVLLRDREPVVVADTSDRADLSIASMAREDRTEPVTQDPAPRERPDEPESAPRVLPDKPTAEQLRAVLAAVRPEARRCGPRHGAAAGTKVQVKLSIAGTDGRVISAIPKARPPDDPVGRCVADALREASFPSFGQPSLSLLYSVTL